MAWFDASRMLFRADQLLNKLGPCSLGCWVYRLWLYTVQMLHDQLGLWPVYTCTVTNLGFWSLTYVRYRKCTLELSWSRNNCTVSHYIHSTCVHSAPHEAAPLTTSRSTRGVCTEPPHVVIAMLSDQPAVVDDFWLLDWDKQDSQQDGRQEDGAKRVIFL